MLLIKIIEKAIICFITTICIVFVTFIVAALIHTVGFLAVCISFLVIAFIYYRKQLTHYAIDIKIQKELNRLNKHIKKSKIIK